MVCAEQTVAMTKALQRCAVCSGMSLGVLCKAVQELHECLTSVIQNGNLVDLRILNMAEKDPVAPAPPQRTPSLMPRVEPLVSVTTPSELSTSELEEAAPLEELTLVPRWRPLPPPGFPSHGHMSLTPPTGTDELAHEHTPRSPTGFCLLGVHTEDHLTFSSDG